jgi:hypothetical protein
MKSLAEWLVRADQPKKVRKPMPRVTKRRAKANREYTVRRKRYLILHPYCEAIERIRGHLLETASAKEYQAAPKSSLQLSTEIHHMWKPKSKYLNDESTWIAVCRWSHEYIEKNKTTARQLGLLS